MDDQRGVHAAASGVMMQAPAIDGTELFEQRRLLLEDVCSDLVRFLLSGGDPARFEAVRIDREYALGHEAAFADLRVKPQNDPAYFLEVKYGYDVDTLLAHLKRKYAALDVTAATPSKLVLVVDTAAYPDWPRVHQALTSTLPQGLSLEVWDEARLRELIAECFGQTIPSFVASDLVAIREQIDQ
jgi:hypothetical protein